ncbi:hypothetical protein CcaverHIS002_0109910 [Cutaneotrichosporon cavernicola]|uniref:Uncharacterized protein n=1 Tax=Cutaneotrichosporon cavernicola TaxID=279322 RepID=A0AA48L0I4_9TREE|nr:uncharacterized protein CcaverHIS019_0109830 [Cutaneotrichosporon cavernicola]BEI80462.1 hypothetical protein CcaverHIS002_0109910 [Cutaneotrichosporon cavernicola]BEI88265.1 hypothetical protein CcaverHIS019_0109830 [Cutaneotrichosporon cavernicola]BEI96037.1 hypothetical protein CcaverHIS631_0109860 [Cutaneotrichosporon cavernicola]BEJ03810.1 hypothetical protein CcaverHIS641_0109850 [Cutaneotrichosporon cavernicola]
MSTYSERYDDALSKAPWVAKTSNGRTLLFKNAPYPERKGYLFAATDLETVYFEALLGASVATRLAQVSEREGKETDAGMEQAEAALRSLADAFEGGWGNASVEAETDDYFDAVYFLRSGDFAWQFNMTEMRGRQPLTFIAKHLLSPFSVLMAQDRGVEPADPERPVDAVAAVLSDSGVARALRRVTGAPPPASGKATAAVPASHRLTPVPKRERTIPPATPSAATPAITPSPERTPLARPPTPPRASASQALPPMIPPSSPTPAAKRTRAYDYAAGILPSSGPVSRGASTEPGRSRSTSPLKRVLVAESTGLPPSVPPIPPSDPPSSASDLPSSTQDPLIPTQKKKKRKDKKAEEAEEEAEADKRRAEMKRRMAAGGGGRLGRRR